MSDPEKFLEGALEATSTPWNPPDFTVPAEDFDRVMEALEHPEPTPPELLAKRDEVFEKLGKPKFEGIRTEHDTHEEDLTWCRSLVEQHHKGPANHCPVCNLRYPCDMRLLAELVLELYAELHASDESWGIESWGIEFEDTGIVVGVTFSTEEKAQAYIDDGLGTGFRPDNGWHTVRLDPGDGRRVMID